MIYYKASLIAVCVLV